MKSTLLTILGLIPINLSAQIPTGEMVILEDTNFFISVVAGVLLAVGFQLLLTAISVATGITAVGNIRKKAHQPSSHSSESDHDHGMNAGQKVSTGLGAWTLITTSISLFFASLLGVKLGLIGANFIGATLGLVIWATFFMLITYLEVKSVSSLVGGLASTVKNSLSSASSVFAKSEESVSKDVARTRAKEEAKQMRKQFEKMFSSHDIDEKVEDYIQKLEPQRIDIQDLKKQLKDLITDLQVTEKADYDYPNSVKKMMLEEADQSKLSKEDKQVVKDHINSLKGIAQSDASAEEKAKAGITDLTPADKQQVEKYQEKIKAALKNTNNGELQPEKLEADLKRILNEPKEASRIAKVKASAVDRDTLVKLLASQNMDEQEADKRVSQAEKVLDKLNTFFSDGEEKVSAKKGEAAGKTKDLQAKVQGIFASKSGNLNQVYSDFVSLFRDSGAGPDLKYKLEHYNKNEMTALITNKTSLSHTEAESVAEKIVSARDRVITKANEVEAKVNEKMKEAREKALIAAEESRKAAATAAWWLVATAIVSAAASAVGGMLALESVLF
ncbi:hypothetical protein SAMN04488034_101815 [Salinimicrobium catena]|uniref:Uncharacterized protein n=1 Tax=Salinimicrobium catena TaxID=390640 RepID=A0A1H5JQB2_9FLAO|nr:hypothetical protein [Salinimicrobium catena]SDK89262.1 hypothetical protein SAMN04488140_101801 [Salinimicrobium catena]SEE54594.1 hypothetical protein SAMN04488034_101815 [Salinimicrobium catena]